MNIQTIQDFRRKLRQIEREVQQQVKDGSTCCGVSLTQCHALMELGLVESMTIVDLAMILKLDKSTLSRTIDGLVQIGLVDRAIHPDDRRYMQIRLTEQGRKVFDAINTGCNQLYLKVFECIPPKKHEAVIESLGLFADAIGKVREDESTAASCFCSPNDGKEKS
jgi:DNA-binding MarR family transcriptional regulator